MLGGAAFRFTFVREPLRRFESAYRDKLVRRAPPGVRRCRPILGLPQDRTHAISFEQFLTAVEQQDPSRDGPALAPAAPQPACTRWCPTTSSAAWRPSIATSHRSGDEAGLPDVPVEPRNVARTTADRSVYDGRPDLVRRVEQALRQGLRALRLLSRSGCLLRTWQVADPVDRHLRQRAHDRLAGVALGHQREVTAPLEDDRVRARRTCCQPRAMVSIGELEVLVGQPVADVAVDVGDLEVRLARAPGTASRSSGARRGSAA